MHFTQLISNKWCSKTLLIFAVTLVDVKKKL